MKAIRYLAPPIFITGIVVLTWLIPLQAGESAPQQVQLESTPTEQSETIVSDGIDQAAAAAKASAPVAQAAPSPASQQSPATAPDHAGQTPVSTEMKQRPSTEYLGLNETYCVYTFDDGGTEELSLGVSGSTSNGQGVTISGTAPVCPVWQ